MFHMQYYGVLPHGATVHAIH